MKAASRAESTQSYWQQHERTRKLSVTLAQTADSILIMCREGVIDGSFVKKLPESEVDRHLVRAIVEVARGLRLQTIAEFVEDAETLDLCRKIGVDLAQGYFIGRPRPASEVS